MDAQPLPESAKQEPRVSFFVVALGFELGLALLALLIGWLIGKPPLLHFEWTPRSVYAGIGAVIPMAALFFCCLYAPLRPLVRIRKITMEFIRPLFVNCAVWQLGILSLVAGFGEEMLFRGVLQDLLADYLSVFWAILLAGIVFGLLHSITPTYAILASTLGWYLGWLYQHERNLLVVALAHGLYDFLALTWVMRKLK